jgi:hypothetical protein
MRARLVDGVEIETFSAKSKPDHDLTPDMIQGSCKGFLGRINTQDVVKHICLWSHKMSLSLYDLSVPVFVQSLEALAAVLKKAATHAETRKIDPQILLSARLYPDMFAFTRQVQLASDFAKGGAARVAGVEVPSYADTESSFDDLDARITKTISFITSIPKEKFIGAESRDITVPMRPEPRIFNALVYLRHGALPNFFFHTTTAYDILRHNGVELAKRDFLGVY